jgi:hypothetical protein
MNIACIRLAAQHIAEMVYRKDLVSWMGARQAQDFNMMKWARNTAGSTEIADGAINDGSVIRTHLMRLPGTWFLLMISGGCWS